MVVVYGTPYEETKMEFIDELHIIMTDWDGPTLLGGDFNIVRSQLKKVMD
jgi:endonuclease/exonuclease/phosphatase (EEP) superfamily protein YafD